MKIIFRITGVIILCLSVTINGLAQKKQDNLARERIFNFVSDSNELNNYSTFGFNASFSGNFVDIPIDLRSELSRSFSQYEFYIAKMSVLIDPPIREYDLILFFDTKEDKVKGFIWGYFWTLPSSDSLSSLFITSLPSEKRQVLNQVISLAKLISFVNGDTIGKVKIENRKVKVELLRGEGVLAILEAKTDKCFRFEQLILTDSRGKKMKTFTSKSTNN
jgi:hypothetical protein